MLPLKGFFSVTCMFPHQELTTKNLIFVTIIRYFQEQKSVASATFEQRLRLWSRVTGLEGV